MRKPFLFTLSLLLTAVCALAQRGWTPPSEGAYPSHAVVYATLRTSSGTPVGSVGSEVKLGAFIDGECRAVAVEKSVGSATTSAGQTYVFTLRVPVAPEDKGKAVAFALRKYSDEFSLTETVTVSGADETVGGIPSNPFVLTFTPPTGVSAPDRIDINVGGKVKLLDLFTVTPADATLPDKLPWDFGNSAEYINVDADNVLTGLKPNAGGDSGAYLGLPLWGEARGWTTVYVHQPITGMTLNPDYPDATITVNVNDDKTLNALLDDVLVITPADATEKPVWTPSDTEAIQEAEPGNGWWAPVKPGTYTMTASAPGVSPVTVTVKIVRRAEKLEVTNFTSITVLQGDEVTQYLPHVFTILPADATVGMEGISYAIDDTYGAAGVLQANSDGTITAAKEGEACVKITHSDIPDKPLNFYISVQKMEDKSTASVLQDPLTVELKQYELQKADILTQLKGNIENDGKRFPNYYKFAETAGDGGQLLDILTNGDGHVTEVMANKYGETTVTWTYTMTAAGFEADGKFSFSKAYTYVLSHRLIVSEGLESLSLVLPEKAGLADEEILFRVETKPAGYLLDEGYLKWDIPYSDTYAQQAFGYPERVEGKNEWRTKANFLGNHSVSLYYNQLSAEGTVSVGQRVRLGEGWSWVSLYTNEVSADQFSDLMQNAQEVRSRGQLTYNDPQYGFFGDLEQMTTSEGYKVGVKEGQAIDFVLGEGQYYSYTSGRERAFGAGWTWMSNPFCFDHSLTSAFGKVVLPNDSRVVSRADGFATFQDGNWVGTLERVRAGEAYLVYNAGSDIRTVELPAEGVIEALPFQPAAARAARKDSHWSYASARFADNMGIIAAPTTALDPSRYTIGAFVGDECRGEGRLIDGRFFITVHGQMGDVVSLRLRDELTGETTLLPERVDFALMAGTYARPVSLSTPVVDAISTIRTDAPDIYFDGGSVVVPSAIRVEVYDTRGLRLQNGSLPGGVYVVRAVTPQGIITRTLVKR